MTSHANTTVVQMEYRFFFRVDRNVWCSSISTNEFTVLLHRRDVTLQYQPIPDRLNRSECILQT